MKNPKEFAKLYGINIPFMDKWEYYIDTVSEKDEKISFYRELFNDLEESLGEDSAGKFFVREMNRVVAHLKTTEAYRKLTDWIPTNIDHFAVSSKRLAAQGGGIYTRLDLVSANHSVMRMIDSELLPWTKMLEGMNIHPAFAASKRFRQVAYGNLNPKRTQAIQKRVVQKVAAGMWDKPWFMTADEIVYEGYDVARELADVANGLNITIEGLVRDVKIPPFRIEMFQLKKIPSGYVVIENGVPSGLHGVPGCMFYPVYRKYIIGDEPTDLDLTFEHEGRKAMWINEEF